jgi:ABC-type glutathione transport system ATPase component
VALDGVDLAIEPGERVALLGESGSGKTTLARIGLGLTRPTAGINLLFGQDTAGWGPGRWRQARHRAQLLFQDPRSMLNPEMRLGDLMRESARLHRPDGDPVTLVREMLEAVGLRGREHSFAHEFSGGERRRAGLARVLLARPQLLVTDEPTAGLDAGLKADLVQLIVDRIGPACAWVLITHDLSLALWACTRLVVLHEGRVVDTFLARDLPEHRPHPQTARLLDAAGLRPHAEVG